MHVIPPDQWGVVADSPWQHVPGYMVWYGRVSYPKILPPIDGSPPMPANQEQIIAQKHDKDMSGPLEITRSCVHIADEALT